MSARWAACPIPLRPCSFVLTWDATIEKQVPIGTGRSKVEAWVAANTILLRYDADRNQLYGVVEKVPEPGLKFPCSDWNVIVEIRFDTRGRVLNHFVHTVGTCL
jgi:hypothetical protein